MSLAVEKDLLYIVRTAPTRYKTDSQQRATTYFKKQEKLLAEVAVDQTELWKVSGRYNRKD